MTAPTEQPVAPQEPLFQEPQQRAPSPADLAPRAQSAAEPVDGDSDDAAAEGLTPEEKVRRARRQTDNLRTRLKEAEQRLQAAEPIVKAHTEAQEAAKTEVQRAIERADAAEKREAEKDLALYRRDLAEANGIPREKMHLLGSGSREEMEAIATEIGPLFATATNTPRPPSDRPVEGLRPGATPEPPKQADTSYPAEWGFTAPRQT